MIINAAGTQAISTLGWVDRGAVWICAADEASPRKVTLSDAKWLSVKAGTHDFFAVLHNWDGDRLEISAHSHSDVDRVVSRISFLPQAFGPPAVALDGEGSVWQRLPHAFTGFAFGDYRLILTDDGGRVEVQGFDWFDNSYDKGYQGIIGVTETRKAICLSFQFSGIQRRFCTTRSRNR